MRVATYRRVSTDIQVEEGVSLATQKERLLSYIQSQGWTLVEDYVDEGYSAKNTDRPAMQRLIADIKKQKFDVVLVYKLDRFVRSVLDLHELLQLMEKYDVKFKSATEVFDTTSATGRLFITLIATLAQWERETIAERVYTNMRHRSEQGLRNGGPPPYGYKSVNGKLVKNEEEAKWVRFMFDQYKAHGTHNIAMKLNKMGVKTRRGEKWNDFVVRYIITNPIYCGKIRWNHRSLANRKMTGEDVIVPINQDDFEPIVTEEEFEDAQKRMKERRIMPFKSKTHYPFSGVVKCARCGYSFVGSNKKRKDGSIYRYYKCRGRFNFGYCDMQAIAEESIERAFLETFDFTDPSFIQDIITPSMDKETIQKELEKIQMRKERAEELYLEGDIDKKRYKEIMEDIRESEHHLMSELNAAEQEASADEIREFLANVKQEWHNLTFEERQMAIQSIFKSFTIELVRPTKSGRNPEPPIVKITDYELR